jgi:hypothetical protein
MRWDRRAKMPTKLKKKLVRIQGEEDIFENIFSRATFLVDLAKTSINGYRKVH